MAMSRTAGSGRWAPWIAAALFVALICGLLAFWAMQLLSPPVTIAPTGSLVSDNSNIDTGATRLLFGNASGDAPVTKKRRARVNVDVIGVAVGRTRSAAILAVDGKPAEAFGEGDEIDDNITIKSVSSTKVVLDQDGEEIEVDVPARADLAILTSGDNGDGSVAAPVNASPARSNVRPAARPTTRPAGNRPALAPRRLPPSGAAAAAAASRNTTGVGAPNTPGATRRNTPGRPPVRSAVGQPGATKQPATRVNSSSAVNNAVGQPSAQNASPARVGQANVGADGANPNPNQAITQ